MGRPKLHGKSHQTEYVIYHDIIRRCYNKKRKNYSSYGGRGITVCDRWLESFKNFYDDMGDRPSGMSLDRIDNNGNYEHGNCRWATAKEQRHNQRIKNNNISNLRLLTVGGITKCLSDWAIEKGIGESTIRNRLRKSFSEEEAIAPSSHLKKFVLLNGEKVKLFDLAKKYGIKTNTLRSRLYSYKWSLSDALSKPVKKR